MFYPIASGVTLIGAMLIARARGSAPVSPEIEAARRHIYVDAMMSKHLSPEYLRELSDRYREQGMRAEADMLIKRAQLMEAPPELKKARREALRDAFQSTDVDWIRHMANLHEDIGALGACAALRDYADGLVAKGNQAPDSLPDEEAAQ